MRTRIDSTRSGIALLLSALLLGVLIAFVGMAVDLGFFLSTRSQLQTAADLAVLAGAGDLAAGEPAESVVGAVLEAAALNGVESGREATTVEVRTLADQAEIEIRREAPTFFTRIFGRNDLTLVARATARVAGGQVALTQ